MREAEDAGRLLRPQPKCQSIVRALFDHDRLGPLLILSFEKDIEIIQYEIENYEKHKT